MKEACSGNQTYLNRLLLVCGIFSVVALAGSFLAEYWWKVEPCKLCKLQRLPYFCVLGLTCYGFAQGCNRGAVWGFRILFGISLGLAGYHCLVLAKIVPDPCAVPIGIQTLDDFSKLLDVVPPC